MRMGLGDMALTRAGRASGASSGTNLLTFPEAFDNAAWFKGTGSTVTADATAAPNGTTTADKIEETATTDFHAVRQIHVQAAVSRALVLSFRLKQSNRTKARIFMEFTAGSGSGVFADFDLAAGTANTATAQGTATGVTAGISAAANGFYTCWVSAIMPAETDVYCLVRMLDAASAQVYLGTATQGLFAWGAKLETGATPTGYP